MATKAANMTAFGGAHTAGIFSDMTVDGPVIGTLVVIMDRARNLPNKRTMGKQDPYCAARLGKEAKKTKTDKRGGQTPKWDQELRFTVHDSPDYQRLKVSVFNDDKKTELIGETWANLEAVITPGGGQSDDWHGLTCKGKYAGEIRIESTYYDTRPKAEKPAPEKRRESLRPDGQGAAVGGPRESTPVKRRPLPTDPTGASPSPVNTPEHRGLRGVRAGPRELGSPRHQQQNEQTLQQKSQPDTPSRRPVPDASPLNGTPMSNQNTPQRPPMPQNAYSTPPNPRSSNPRVDLTREESFDMSYAAPKPYQLQAIDPLPQQVRDPGLRTMSQDEFRATRGISQQPPPPAEPIHSHSAPMVPTQHSYEQEAQQEHYDYQDNGYTNDRSPSYPQDPYQDPAYQVAPLRTIQSRDYIQEQISSSELYYQNRYIEAPPQHDLGSARRRSAMQPMVEDEGSAMQPMVVDEDLPPPPPVHRRNASTLPHPQQQEPPSYVNETPAPLNFSRYREEAGQIGYDAPLQSYGSIDYGRPQPSERRMTLPRSAELSSSRPVSRDTMAPSPLRQETSALPLSLVPGLNPARQERDSMVYQAPPAYETPPRLRHYSEPAEYRAITEYETPVQSQELVHHQSFPSANSPYDYPHDPPEQPRRTSPFYDPTPLVKPRATSPGVSPGASPRYSPNPASERTARGPVRSMPTRKSVSPRPPPPTEDYGERRMSGVAFNPDSYDVYNPRASTSPAPGVSEDERPGSRMEYNDKGQIVTFSGRVVDASDHLPIDNWAPEPTPKGTVKEKTVRSRAQLNGSRDLEAARQREERYQRERVERDRLRRAASTTFDLPSSALVTARHDFSAHTSSANSSALVLADYDATQPGSADRSRLQQRTHQQRPMSSYDSSPSLPMSDTHILRERPVPNSYGSSPGYERGGGGGYGGRAPPIPAKIPLETGRPVQNEDMALSLELQSIDIGPGSGGRRPRAQSRRQYGF
ncbi:uncharacterized protein K460DRAFT_375745 [Cucurbitaria berberidis CBS 394.84]|uniref:C2 domain-containing protein n=1 Tax=Cucurbitaria berberidis CBS 394.84 TaxID=1168544 RepID=A0A9P4GPY9_9PLEO|nr:uncharacterized protein K460DRAFT_375745 [Cucurbitaria berberidis CBS 394.84]KAF1849011.1 hypothetical protein K460DRAFT_375745 [Cucurbitaria berberidis CBS 394.84]